MFGPSLSAWSGSGWVSTKSPSAPAASAALASGSANSRSPPLFPPAAPGSWTLWVASNTVGRPFRRMIANERMSTTRFWYPKVVPRSVCQISDAPPRLSFPAT